MNGIWCVGLIVMKCFAQEPVPLDSFCQLYDRVIVAKGDSAISAPLSVKRRILANELKYRKFCNAGAKGN